MLFVRDPLEVTMLFGA